MMLKADADGDRNTAGVLNIPGSDQYPIQFIKEIRRKYIQAAQKPPNR